MRPGGHGHRRALPFACEGFVAAAALPSRFRPRARSGERGGTSLSARRHRGSLDAVSEHTARPLTRSLDRVLGSLVLVLPGR
jgi:hypothetical protein